MTHVEYPKIPDHPRAKLYYVLYLLLTVGLVASMVIAVLRSHGIITGILACLLPFALLLVSALFFRFVNKLFHSRVGSIAVLIYLIVMVQLIPTISNLLYLAFLVIGGWILLQIFGLFAPDGYIEVERRDSQGRTFTETKRYYGSRYVAEENEKKELEKKGYKNIRIKD